MSPAQVAPVAWAWQPRPVALAPQGLAAQGSAARRLARRLLSREAGDLALLTGVAGPGLLVLLGAAETLPWEEGVVYLGHDDAARSILVPTTLTPTVPLSLLARALSRVPGAPEPLALLPDGVVASVAQARPLVHASLEAWLATGAGA